MNATALRLAVAGVFAAGALAACDRDTDRTLSQKLDNAVSRTKTELAEAGRKTKEELAIAGGKAKQELAVAGEKTRAGADEASAKARSPQNREAMSDAVITASIKTDYLKDPDLSVLKIDVDTKGGVVTLNGLAGDEAARVRAEKLAEGIKGVREVHNYLVVKHA